MSKASIETDIKDYSNHGCDVVGQTSHYQNPVPHLGGKKFLVHLSFDFNDWIEIEEAKENIEEYFKRNGIPNGAISDITPMKEYK